MVLFLKKVYHKIKRILSYKTRNKEYDFNISNPLGGNGERVDIQLNKAISFDMMDMYQKNHWRRYEFAKEIIKENDVCGDFACGTGYGAIMLSDKASFVTGADLNASVIAAIRKRYDRFKTVTFLNTDLLDLTFKNHFDSIISFETLEHFDEANIIKLLAIFSKALKQNGKLIFSTPYMQEQSEAAIKMGFHLTFYINEEKIKNWLQEAGLQIEIIKYQNYDTHIIGNEPGKKEFIIGVAGKHKINA